MKKENPNTEKIWIVKASESILGPFSLEEVAKSVRSKSLGLLDEIKNTQSRWIFIRDLPEMQKIISELAMDEDTVEKTQTAAHTQVSITKRLDDDETPIPIQIPIPPPPMEPQQERQKSSTEREPIKTYSLNPQKHGSQVLRWLLSLFVVMCAILAGYSFWQRKSFESRQKKIWSQMQQLFAAKLYLDSFKELKNYQLDFPDQPTGLTRAGLLYLNPGRELVKSKRLFEKSSQFDPTNKDLMLLNLNGLGLVSLYEGQAAASKSYLDRALTLEPNNTTTRLNLISWSMSQSRWNDAYQLAQVISPVEPKKAHLIQGALSLLSNSHRERSKSAIHNLVRSIDSSSYLRPEMRLLIIRLASLQSDFELMQTQFRDFFDDLPSLQLQFSEDPTIDQRWKDWNFLYQFCSEVNGPDSMAADLLALQVVCVSQIQKWNEAERILTEGLKRFPGHPRLLLAQLHMLSSMERWPEVRALMRLQGLSQEFSAQWMFAKTCLEEKNRSCAENYLNPLIQMNDVGTPVYQLRAQMLCQKNPTENCRFSVNQGLALDSLATGLLKIRYDLDEGAP